jgi:hypothetical protein
LDALPVVDAGGVFFGIIRHRMLRQIAGPSGDQEGQPVVRTLVSLGELYWSGLSAFLAGVNAVAPAAASQAAEATHGAE